MSGVRLIGNDTVQVIAGHAAADLTFAICDDCRGAYPEPAYYTFEVEACVTTEITPDGETEMLHMNTEEGCTGNLCPECAGLVIPDDPQDPRATPETRQEAKDMGLA